MRATDIARAMVVEYGMGKTLGLSTYPRQRGPVFLAFDGGHGGRQDYSDATAADIDSEVKTILEQRHQHVLSMLKERREKLEAIAEQLLVKEVLLEVDFNQLVNS
jgi:cell division protease FtsH